MPIKCVVLDDEPKAVQVLAAYINEIPELKLLETFINPFEALVKLPKLSPELIFVDIEMPEKNGFDFLDEVRLLGLNPEPDIVFTTGYDQFAVKAIKKQAFDYLLKPVSRIDILELLTRKNQRDKQELTTNGHNQTENGTGKLRFNTLNGFYVIEIRNVTYVMADGNYSILYLKDGDSKLVTSNLAKVESLLIGHQFQRISRSIIINITFLTQVDRKQGVCILNAGSGIIKLPINRKNIKELASKFF